MDYDDNIISYVASCRDSFAERPFCDADALALCALSYYRYEDIEAFGRAGSVRLVDFLEHAKLDRYVRDLYGVPRMAALLQELVASPRFSGIELSRFAFCHETEITAQFAAVTLHVPGIACPFCVFRGTDTDPVGWHEDFNLSVMEAVPAQLFASAYFSAVRSCCPGARFHLLGHSKGGMLAEYVLADACDEGLESIIDVLAFDSPGLSSLAGDAAPELSARDERLAARQEERQGRFRKYLFPALIGLMLDRRDPFQFPKVQKAQHAPENGHDLFTPRIVDGKICTEKLSQLAVSRGAWFNRWVEMLTMDERHAVIDCVFGDDSEPDAGCAVLMSPKAAVKSLRSVLVHRLRLPRDAARNLDSALFKLLKAVPW